MTLVHDALASPPDCAALEERLLRAVERESRWMLGKLADFMAIPSELGHERAALTFIEQTMRTLNLQIDRVPMEATELRKHDLASTFDWDVTGKRIVAGVWPGQPSAGRSLILSGHVDVLPPPSPALWPSPPYNPQVDPDGVSGWGGLKAGLVAMLGAIRALKAEGLAPLGLIRVQAVPEEESGGNGTLAAALSLPSADAALVAGCAGPTIAVAQFGVAWLNVHVAVPPGHASEIGDDGSAITKALQVSDRLRRFADELKDEMPQEFAALANPIGFNMGVIQGGTAPSMTAGECVIRCRIGFFPGMTLAELVQRAREAVASFAESDPVLRQHPPVVTLDGFGAEPFELDLDSDFVRALADAHSRAGERAELVTSTTATDTRIFAGTGVPAACVGPVVQNLHGIEERVLTEDLVQSAKVVALLIAEWVGLQEERP